MYSPKVSGFWKAPIVNAHLFVAGVFIARGKEDALVTKNLVLGELVYGEKRISVEVSRTKKKVPVRILIIFAILQKRNCSISVHSQQTILGLGFGS